MAGVDTEFSSAYSMSAHIQSIGVAIPAYRNAERLRRCLNSIKTIDSSWLASITVVDDSGDGSVAAKLRAEFDLVSWIVHERNQGFVEAANRAVKENSAPFVLLLNDDAEILNDPRSRALDMFADPKVFAISLRSVNEHGETREGAKRLVWRAGIARILHDPKDQVEITNGVSSTAYAVGGHAIYRRSAFEELGGFDSLFFPFYWEDVDLSCRARYAGYKVVYFAESAIMHSEHGAIKSTHDSMLIRRATWRNRLLFSNRHSHGFQRSLLPVGLLWHQIVATIKADVALNAAITEYRTMCRRMSR